MTGVLWVVETYSPGPHHRSEPVAVFDTEAEAEQYVEESENGKLAVTGAEDKT